MSEVKVLGQTTRMEPRRRKLNKRKQGDEGQAQEQDGKEVDVRCLLRPASVEVMVRNRPVKVFLPDDIGNQIERLCKVLGWDLPDQSSIDRANSSISLLLEKFDDFWEMASGFAVTVDPSCLSGDIKSKMAYGYAFQKLITAINRNAGHTRVRNDFDGMSCGNLIPDTHFEALRKHCIRIDDRFRVIPISTSRWLEGTPVEICKSMKKNVGGNRWAEIPLNILEVLCLVAGHDMYRFPKQHTLMPICISDHYSENGDGQGYFNPAIVCDGSGPTVKGIYEEIPFSNNGCCLSVWTGFIFTKAH